MRYTASAERGRGPIWVLQCVEYPGGYLLDCRARTMRVRLVRVGLCRDDDEACGRVSVAG